MDSIGHPRRERVYQYILSYIVETAGRPPTLDEIVAACDVPKTTLHHHLDVLKEDGRITIEPGVSRGIGIPGARVILPPGLLAAEDDPDDDEPIDDWARTFYPAEVAR